MSEKWNIRMLKLAFHIASWSKDPSTKVGAVIADGNKVISHGYNGFPVNVKDDDELYLNREIKYKRIIHAEKNAIMFAERPLYGCDLYVTLPPCSQCAGMIIQKEIAEVHTIILTDEQKERWGKDMDIAAEMFGEAGIDIYYHNISNILPFSI